jgi:putative protease
MIKNNDIELLAPAGNLEKAFVAFNYGADAIYIGGPNWGLRKAAGNFSLDEIKLITGYAIKNLKKVYVVTNIYAYDEDLDEFQDYLDLLDQFKVSAVIFSDPGIFSVIDSKKYNFEKHLSTQASTVNYETAKFWKNLGVSRIVLGRETSIDEAQEISEKADVEIEMFLHGAVCMSFSGKCMISNFTANRDANRGGCVQSCRWNYKVSDVIDGEEIFDGYPLNSRDLLGINLLEDFINKGIKSLKIEGRMKSNFYIARTVSIYRDAIDTILKGDNLSNGNIRKIENVSNRGFNNLFLNGVEVDSIRLDSTKYKSNEDYIGIIEEIDNDMALMKVKNGFTINDNVYLLSSNNKEYKLENFYDYSGKNIEKTNPNTVAFFNIPEKAKKYNVIFRKK